MLPLQPENKTTFGRRIKEGDLVILYERHDRMKAVRVQNGAETVNKFGVFAHSDWIGKPFGTKVFSKKGGFVYLLAPTPELWTLVLSHRTQILYIADISFVVSFLEICPGCLVLESGTGSGSLTTALARAVAPTGHVYTFDFHELRADSARKDFEKNGLSSLITVEVRDIQGKGFPEKFCGDADAVFLDLPQPWLALPSAAEALKPDGILCSFSPCIEQVQRVYEILNTIDFTDVRTFEVLLRTYEVREKSFTKKVEEKSFDEISTSISFPCKRLCSEVEGDDTLSKPTNVQGKEAMTEEVQTVMARPYPETKGHTGYLTFARRCV